MKDREFDEREFRFLVCKMLTWDKIVITLADGREQALSRSEDQPIIGFVPVYEDRETAIAESGGLDIIALMTGPAGEFIKEGDPDAKTEGG